MKVVKSVVVSMCLTGIVPFAACAATYYSGEGTAHGSLSDAVNWYTDEARQNLADPQPEITENDGNTYVFLSSKKMENGAAFPAGTHVCLGMDGNEIGSTAATYNPNCNSATWNIPDCTIYGLRFCPNYRYYGQFLGNYRLVKTAYAITFGGSNIKDDTPYGENLSGTFTGDDDVMVTVTMLSNSGALGTGYTRVRLDGDFSGYKGRFETTALTIATITTGYNLIWFASATAMGDPESPFVDAVTLRHKGYIRIDEVVTQTSARGITLDLSEGQYAGLHAADGVAWTLRAPLYSEANGTLKKVGGGKVTLAGQMGATNILVEAGTLVVSNGATFAEGTVVTVADGATLVNMTAASIPNLSVSVEDGGTYSAAGFEVPFDGTDATTLDRTSFTAADRAVLTKPISIKLSQAIPLPFSETNRWAVATFDSSAGFTAADFTDGTPKTLGRLPTTWLETETENGVTTLYLVARPAIEYIYATVKAQGRLTSAENWSDGELPHAGKDYFDRNGSQLRTGSGSAVASYSFNGESFTFVGEIRDYAQNFYMKELRLGGGHLVTVIHASSDGVTSTKYRPRIFRGLYEIETTATDAKPAKITVNSIATYADLQVTLAGSGTLQLSTGTKTVEDGGDGIHPYYFTGMSANFTGRLDLVTADATTVMDMYVTNGLTFGGALAAYSADAVRLRPSSAAVDGAISITAMADTTVDAANRGWSATSVTLGASNGVTFVFAPPTLTLGTKLRKTGGGTLALGCATIGGGTAFAVEEGYVKALSGDCCTNLDLAVSAGAGLKADLAPADPVVAAKGLVAKSILPAAEGGSILVAPDLPADFEEPGSFTAVVCTVPASQADLSSVLTAHPVANYRGTVVKDSETFAEEGLVVYSAVWRMTGMTIIIK